MHNEPPPILGLPPAWQPFTFRGVAAFSQAGAGRLLLAQFLVAALVAAAVCWFLSLIWFPTVRKAIRELPEAGAIEHGRRTVAQDSPRTLVETRFLAVVLDPDTASPIISPADLRLEFHRTNFAVCAAGGCLRRPYPVHRVLPFNRSDLESAWGAWQPMFFGFATLGVFAILFISWLVLATIYFPVPWLIAYFKDRRLTVAGSWKLAAAALLPGALLAALGLVLYGLGLVNLVQLTLLWAAHLPLGWVYLACAPRRLPRVPDAAPRRRNPFGRMRDGEMEAASSKR